MYGHCVPHTGATKQGWLMGDDEECVEHGEPVVYNAMCWRCVADERRGHREDAAREAWKDRGGPDTNGAVR